MWIVGLLVGVFFFNSWAVGWFFAFLVVRYG
jgi:hypothetical protein